MDIDNNNSELFGDKYWIDRPTCKISLHEQRSEPWFRLRKCRITASIAASCCGLGQYKTKEQALHEIIWGGEDLSKNPHVLRGIKYEDPVRNWYSKTFSIKAVEVGLAISKKNQFISASLDAELYNDDGSPSNVCLEIKNPIRIKKCLLDKDLTLIERISPEYYIQCLVQMYVTDKKYCDFVCYSVMENKIFAERIPFDSEYWDNTILPKLTDFIDNLLKPELLRLGIKPILL